MCHQSTVPIQVLLLGIRTQSMVSWRMLLLVTLAGWYYKQKYGGGGANRNRQFDGEITATGTLWGCGMLLASISSEQAPLLGTCTVTSHGWPAAGAAYTSIQCA